MNRIAVLSDLHGNHRGLLCALNDIERCDCDWLVCLGDLVDGGEEEEAVVAEIQARRIPTVRGNHDEIHASVLQPETEQYLLSLPEMILNDGVCFTHISPRENPKKIRDRIEAWNVFDETPHRLTFVGHLHIPFIFAEKSPEPCSARLVEYRANTPVPLDRDDRYIVCPGAVGYPRDGVRLIRYAIFDRRSWTVEIRAVAGPLLSFDAFFHP